MSERTRRIIAVSSTPISLLAFAGGLIASFQTTFAILRGDLQSASAASVVSTLFFLAGVVISIFVALACKRWARDAAASQSHVVYWVAFGALLSSAAFQVLYLLLSLLSSFL